MRWLRLSALCAVGVGLVWSACGRFGFDGARLTTDDPDAPVEEQDAMVIPDSGIESVTDGAVTTITDGTVGIDAPPALVPGTGCGGLPIQSNVLANNGFETGLCTNTSVSGWAVTKSASWSYYANRPMASDNAGCGVTDFGCNSTRLPSFPNTGNGCLAMWGGSATAVGQWVEVRQTVNAPAPIQGLALAYSRGSDQLEFGWEYELSYEIAGIKTVVEKVGATGMTDTMGRYTMSQRATPLADTEITIALRLRRVQNLSGHVWAYFDNITLDLCW
ncbi:MAG: hypothetical protein AB7P03_29780 [Kofleriaceae bacterium]